MSSDDQKPSIGQLFADASRDLSSLVQEEIALAKSELKFSLTFGGVGAALLALAAFLLLLVIVLLSVTVAYFINWNGHGLALHWSFLIVTGFWLFTAVAAGVAGVLSLKKVRAPKRAIAQAQATAQAFKR